MAYGSDVINIKSIDTGGNNAGNGGNGHSSGDISNQPSIKFAPVNKAEGADVDVKTGDHVNQKAYWDAGSAKGGDASAKKAHEASVKANGGETESNGDQKSWSGHNTSDVVANTKASQMNKFTADQSQMAIAGNGGDGGSDNMAVGGDVHVKLAHTTSESTTNTLKDVLNEAEHFHIDDFVHI
jgi:hypothetical protein